MGVQPLPPRLLGPPKLILSPSLSRSPPAPPPFPSLSLTFSESPRTSVQPPVQPPHFLTSLPPHWLLPVVALPLFPLRPLIRQTKMVRERDTSFRSLSWFGVGPHPSCLGLGLQPCRGGGGSWAAGEPRTEASGLEHVGVRALGAWGQSPHTSLERWHTGRPASSGVWPLAKSDHSPDPVPMGRALRLLSQIFPKGAQVGRTCWAGGGSGPWVTGRGSSPAG